MIRLFYEGILSQKRRVLPAITVRFLLFMLAPYHPFSLALYIFRRIMAG